MATTIQHIELPKLARARDTSSGRQDISGNYIINGTFTTDANWTAFGGGITIDGSDSNKCVITTDGENQSLKTAADLWAADSMAGKMVRLKYQIVANSDSIVLNTGGFSPSTGIFENTTALISTVGYHEVILQVRTDTGTGSGDVLFLWLNHDTGETLEIDNIELHEVEFFSNNNHGQIYSGRALEFDGVGDKLTASTSVSTDYPDVLVAKQVTMAGWINIPAFPVVSSGSPRSTAWSIHPSGVSGLSRMGLLLGASGAISHTIYNGSYVHASGTININTWYRIVCTCDDSNIKLYINGILQTGTSGNNHLGSLSTNTLEIGYNAHDGGAYYNGMMSDFQLWDKAFTQADVTFDYLNPEETAISGSGTALTESNLKLWYPMQDGHRGQQSYILDGANSGLSSEMVANGDFDGASSWTTNHANITVSNGKGRFDNPSVYTRLTNSPQSIKSGVSYIVTATISDFVSGFVYFRMPHNNTTQTMGANGTFQFTGVADADYTEVVLSAGTSSTKLNVDNVSVKAINDKHHATTVFHGDELVTNGDCEVTDPTTIQIGNEPMSVADATMDDSTEQASGGSKSIKVTADSSSSFPALRFVDGSDMGLIAGRTYEASCFVYLPASQTMSRLEIKAQNNSGTTVASNTTDATNTWTKISVTFTDDDIANIQILGFKPDGSGGFIAVNNNYFYVDNISIKEVGVASGWTDADQQLHIPQTALQSYNELAWFDGLADYVAIADHNDFSFGNATTDSAMSISAWIYMNDATTFPVICKDSADQREWQLRTTGGDTLTFMLWDDSTDAYQGRSYNTAITSREGEWLHVVATYSGNQADADAGINLYINGVLVDNVDNSSGSYTAMENKTAGIRIGSNERATSYANGAITETSIWADELSQAEVNELYNDGKALDALTHSAAANIKGYWRNNGLSTWVNLNDPGTHDGTPTSVTETLLIPQGIDSSRDSQGFIMNREKNTSCLNLTVGTDDYVDIPVTTAGGTADDDLAFIGEDNAFSISCWVKKNNVSSGEWVINRNDATDGWRVGFDGSERLKLQVEKNGTLKEAITGALSLNTWYHIVATTDAGDGDGNIKLYLDGVTGGGTTTNATDGLFMDESASVPLTIGFGHTASFEGAIDGVLIYDDVLTQAEVTRNYKATKGSHRN